MNSSSVRVGAIDIGSNSTNLLIVEIDVEKGTSSILQRVVTTTRLGAAVDSTRMLSVESMTRTLDVLTQYRAVLDHHRVGPVRVVASNSCREDVDWTGLVARVSEATRFDIEPLSVSDAGRLSYAGAMTGRRPGPMGDLVIDIGDGSTGFILGVDGALESAHCIAVGAGRLTERHLLADPPRPEDLSNAVGDTADLVDDLMRHTPSLSGRRQVIGVGGIIDTIAAVETGVADPAGHDGLVLSRTAIEEVFRTLATEPLRDRVHNPGLPAERAGIIVGGCCILVAALRRLQIDSLVVARHDILDGICAEFATQVGTGDVRR